MLPDLLGEWFVLRQLQFRPERIGDVLEWCWGQDAESVSDFLLRIAQDFPKQRIAIKILSQNSDSADKIRQNALSKNAASMVSALLSAEVDQSGMPSNPD